MNKIMTLLVLALIGIIVLERTGCSGALGLHSKADTLITHDTTYEVHDSLITKKMVVNNTVFEPEYIKGDTKYIPDTNYAVLKAQFEALVKEHASKNMYKDSLKLDSIGYVVVSDTVQFNKLDNRGYQYHYSLPHYNTTMTITKHDQPKTQLYIGGGIDGNRTLGITGISAGLLLKNKKDQIYGLKVGTDIHGQIVYGMESYWKIKLKK